MISTNDLKRIFSKAYITLCDGCVRVNYISSEKSKWATQCFDDEDNTKEMLETLLLSTESLAISVSSENGVKLEFETGEETGMPETLVYCPSAHNLTDEEFAKIIEDNKDEPSPNLEAFLNHFDGVDLKDEDAVFEKLSEFILKITGTEDVISFDGFSNWTILNEKAREFSEKYEFGFVDVLHPGTNWNGCITLSTSITDGCRFWNFTGEGKAELLDLVLNSTDVSIDCGLTEGTETLNITFFA